jgi:hypothetical protein
MLLHEAKCTGLLPFGIPKWRKPRSFSLNVLSGVKTSPI